LAQDCSDRHDDEKEKAMISRRDVLATAVAGVAMSTTAAAAASVGNPNEPPQGAINAKNPASVTDPGPQNPAIRDQFPSAFSPPATDVGSMPQIWASFNNAPRRILAASKTAAGRGK